MRKTIFALFLAFMMIPMTALAQGVPGGPGWDDRGGPGVRGQGGPGMRGPGGPGGKGAIMADELGLTDEQMAKMRDIHSKHRKAMIDQKATIEKAMLDLTEELQKEKADKSVVDKAIDQIVKTKADMERSKLVSMVEAAAILTPEQKKKAAQKMTGSLMGGKGGFGGGQRGPAGPGGGPRGPFGPGGDQGQED